MSNFLHNLARRSAGLPLSTEFSPTPPPVFKTGFNSGEGIEEITSEETATAGPQAALTEPIDMVSSSLTRAPMPAPEIKPEQPTSLSAPESESGTAITPILQTQPASEPALMAKAAAPSVPVKAHVNAAPERSEPIDQQAMTSVRQLTPITNDLHVLPAAPHEPQTALGSQVFAQPTEDTPDAPQVDHAIRPARTERADAFQFPRVITTPAQTPAPLPIHVRVGRIEVKGNAPSQPNTVNTTPIGFAAYQRLRRYRI